ncbi:MAG: hypothetical protein BIFFINMI_01264 [Phycisphaerae bacterium]|nr:hypothetical protein [Phycisphaerae bacterium]
MNEGMLGKQYGDGEIICRQGEVGQCMYVVLDGCAQAVSEREGREVVLGRVEAGEVFGEMAIFDKRPRSATVRACGAARVLTLDKRLFLKRVHEDPSFAFGILQKMSERIRHLDAELSRLKQGSGG